MDNKLFPTSRLLSICLGGIVAIIALLPIHAFISTWGGTAIGPLLVWKSWKEILLVVLLAVSLVWLLRDMSRAMQFFADRFVALIGLYALLTIITALFYMEQNGVEATLAGLTMNLRYPLIAVIVYGIFRYGDMDYKVWRRNAIGFLIAAGTVLATIGILQVTVIPNDFLSQFGYDKSTTIAPYILIDDNPDALRAFATLRGPNDFGAYLILPLLLAIISLKRRRWMIAPIVLMAAGILVSGSRSAWIGTLVGVLCLVVFTVGAKVLRSKKAIIGIVVGFAASLLLFYAAVSIPGVRLAVFHSSPGDSSLTEGSTDAHWQATANGVSRVMSNPTGCGVGCAGPASYYGEAPQISENYYVQIAEEIGLGGFLLWAMIAAIAGRRLYRLRDDRMALALLAAFAGISVIAVLLHVWSDDPLSLTWWALAGMVIGNGIRTQSSKSV